MSDFDRRLAEEQERLSERASKREPGGFGTAHFVVRSGAEPISNVLARARDVLRVVNEASSGAWPSEDQWRAKLPAWFLERCGPEYAPAEIEAMRARRKTQSWEEFTREATEDAKKPWPLSNWVYWFEEDHREWYWWEAEVLDARTGLVAVKVDGWPFAWDALSWLLRASGAVTVIPDEDDDGADA